MLDSRRWLDVGLFILMVIPVPITVIWYMGLPFTSGRYESQYRILTLGGGEQLYGPE